MTKIIIRLTLDQELAIQTCQEQYLIMKIKLKRTDQNYECDQTLKTFIQYSRIW